MPYFHLLSLFTGLWFVFASVINLAAKRPLVPWEHILSPVLAISVIAAGIAVFRLTFGMGRYDEHS